MDQTPPPPPPPPHIPPPPVMQPPVLAAPPQPQVIRIERGGGFRRAVGFVIGMMVFAIVFIVGIVFGVMTMVAGSSMDRVIVSQQYRDGGARGIAIIPVVGAIDGRQAEFVRACVNTTLDDPSIRGVVLRVDSPGGGVTASDQIWYQVGRLQDAGLPVVASFGGVAASGGYYAACNADSIVAEQTTITGSIGVIAQVLTLEGMMDKIGVEPVTLVATGSPQKDVANDQFRQWDERDREKIVTMLDAAYATFLQRVQDGRGNTIGDPTRVRELADGSVYTSAEALESGLVDSIGYLDDAIADAERRAGITTGSARVVVLRDPPSLFGASDILLRGRGALTDADPLDAERLRALVNELTSPRPMYLMH